MYEYLYRFAIEKIEPFCNNPILMILTMFYLKETKLKRVHERDMLLTNIDSYYIAM